MTISTPPAARARTKAVWQALLVTFLWSTSWVLIKLGLQASLPALTFAGLRYTLAFLCLAPFLLFNPVQRKLLTHLGRAQWVQLCVLGVVYYALTQGAQFVSLAVLPAATVTLLLSFSPVMVAIFSGMLKNEAPGMLQWVGVGLSTLGALVYFYPLEILAGQVVGFLVAILGVVANAVSSILGRQINQGGSLPPLLVTTLSMGIGGLLLLVTGGALQGFGQLDLGQWLMIAWLAVVNTALAFTLWNNTLRNLTAVESSIINNTMLPQIAILAWLFLGEALDLRQVSGLVLVGAGTLIVQLWRTAPGASTQAAAE